MQLRRGEMILMGMGEQEPLELRQVDVEADGLAEDVRAEVDEGVVVDQVGRAAADVLAAAAPGLGAGLAFAPQRRHGLGRRGTKNPHSHRSTPYFGGNCRPNRLLVQAELLRQSSTA